MEFNFDQANYTANPGQAIQITETLIPILKKLKSSINKKKINALLSVLGNSNFLARWARRYPDKACEVFHSNLEKAWDYHDYIKELDSSLSFAPESNSDGLMNRFLDFKYRHFFRMTLRDLGLGKEFQETSKENSYLAQAILQKALDFQKQALILDTGTPLTLKDSHKEIPFSIIGMGKLGGLELNYSSDIDIIYFYGSDEGGVFKNKKSIGLSPHEFFSKLSEKITRFLNKKTPNGFLYRVDLELRPEGKAGTIANSINAMEDYYEAFGAFWEKQAMIKASCAAGSKNLYEDFKKRIHPFVYPKTADFNFIFDLKKIKNRVLDSIKTSSDQGYHVKLGPGGIREIEFFVQSLQILFGGKIKTLQTPNTFNAITELGNAKIIIRQEEAELKRAYVFLRTLENRLQQAEEQQTHRLPLDEGELNQVTRRMGYPQKDIILATNKFQKDLDKHKAFVQRMFDGLLSKRYGEPINV